MLAVDPRDTSWPQEGSSLPEAAPEHVRGARLLLWAAVAVVGIDLLFFTGSSNFLASTQARIVNQLLYLGVGLTVAIAAWRGGVDARSPFVLPALAWIAVNLVAALFSQRSSTSIEASALLLLTAPAYLAVRAVTWTTWLAPRVDRLLVAATLAFVVAYLGQALLYWVDWWAVAGFGVPPLRPGDAGLTVGTVNAVALHLELLVPLAAWIAWRPMRRPWLGSLILTLGIAALLITGSRGAWLGSAAAATAVAGIAWLQAGRPIPARGSGHGRVPAIVAGVAIVAAVVVLAPALVPRLLAGDAGRWELWSAAWQMFTSQPLTGTGPGSFPLLRPDTLISEANLAVVTTSHNSVLQVLVDAGILGMVAAAWLLAVLARLAVRALHGRGARPTGAALAVTGGLVAMLVHSLVDTQFHVPAVVLLVLILVARLDPPGVPAQADAPSRRALRRPAPIPFAAGIALVAVGAVTLVPVDAAMVRAQLGNAALDRGDAAAALEQFRWAVATHELAPYRLGEGIAASRLGDAPGAAAAFERAQALHGLTFIAANRAVMALPGTTAGLLDGIEAAGPYDATATVNAAVLRYPNDPVRATEDLALAMAAAPTLVSSERPDELFDDATWEAAQVRALRLIGDTDPALAAALATTAGLDTEAAGYRAFVTDERMAEVIDLLVAAARGDPVDTARARALLREAPGSQGLQGLVWLLGFEALDQSLIDDVRRLSVVAFFGVPLPPLELVVEGSPAADYSVRIPRYPMASDFRTGPKRPYATTMVTIEPVYRPK